MTQPTTLPTAEGEAAPTATERRDALLQQIQAITLRVRELDQAANRRRGLADQVLTPRQEKRSILARIIGRGDKPEPEETKRLREVDQQIAKAQAAASEATDELQVIAELQAELQAEAGQLSQQLPDLNRQVETERFEAARAEIEGEALPEFLAAAEALRQAYGRLAGLGVAHTSMSRRYVDRYGAAPGNTLGAYLPNRSVSFAILGFEVEGRLRTHPTLKGWNYNQIDLLAGELIDQTAADALKRWEA